MKKILLVLLVTSTTGAFAAISWSCSSSDMKQSYLPSGCTSTLSGSDGNAVVIPTAPSVPSITSKAVNYTALFKGKDLASCIKTGNTGTPGGYSALNVAVKSCLNNLFAGVDMNGFTFSPNCDMPESMTSTTEIVDCSPSFAHYPTGQLSNPDVMLNLLSSKSAAEYNGYFPNSSVKLSEGAILCNTMGQMMSSGATNDISGCPSGSYATIWTYGSGAPVIALVP